MICTQTIELTVLVPCPSSSITLDNGLVGTAYSDSISVPGSPVSFTITSGALPSGLSMNGTTGLVSGTPNESGTFVVGVEVEYSGPVICSTSVTITISSFLDAITWTLISGGHDPFGGSYGTVTSTLAGKAGSVDCENQPGINDYPTFAWYRGLGNNNSGALRIVRVNMSLATNIPCGPAVGACWFEKYSGGWENTTIALDSCTGASTSYDYSVAIGAFGVVLKCAAGDWQFGNAIATIDMNVKP